MKGASARRARRRAISVLPTPVGPIIRMFFGVISPRSLSSTCWRRQRLRSAIATARLASCWPTMWRSSSETISCGVMLADMAWRPARWRPADGLLQHLDGVVLVGVDAQLAGDLQRPLHHLGCRQRGVRQQGARGGLRKGAARADGDDAVLGFEHVAVA